jgi:hypothetical protein
VNRGAVRGGASLGGGDCGDFWAIPLCPSARLVRPDAARPLLRGELTASMWPTLRAWRARGERPTPKGSVASWSAPGCAYRGIIPLA